MQNWDGYRIVEEILGERRRKLWNLSGFHAFKIYWTLCLPWDKGWPCWAGSDSLFIQSPSSSSGELLFPSCFYISTIFVWLIYWDFWSEQNAGNFLHGGATATLVDIMGSAVVHTVGAPLTGVSLEISVSYLDAAYLGVSFFFFRLQFRKVWIGCCCIHIWSLGLHICGCEFWLFSSFCSSIDLQAILLSFVFTSEMC